MTSTADPHVFIEEERLGYICYSRTIDGMRWEVFGICDYRGDCLKGAVNPLLGPREGRLDVPIGPNYRGECCPLKVRVL